MAKRARMQTILTGHLDAYAASHRLSARQWQVCRHLIDCRTAALGGLELHCERCKHATVQYHSCRDRHCPRCGQSVGVSASARRCCR